MLQSRFADSLWSDMNRLYKSRAVADLCISLQEEFDADVPVLLFLTLADRSGLGCEDHAFRIFLDLAGEWREHVVRPIRSVRQALKGHCSSVGESELREEIKRIELQAEKLHVVRLAGTFPGTGADAGELAYRYLRERGLSERMCRTALSVLADAVACLGAPDRSPPLTSIESE
jgi:uncharacterized protein (TIGR02444 family)